MSRLDEIERQIKLLAERVAVLEKTLGMDGTRPYTVSLPAIWPSFAIRGDCLCAPNTVCGNAACPRRAIVAGAATCSADMSETPR